MIFIDSGAFLANYLARDRHHAAARAAWAELADTGRPLYTSNFVLDETLTLLGRRASYAYAAARGRELFASERLQILRPTADLELDALERFEKLADQEVSYTDCISFALMRERRIPLACTFDRHFRLAGYETWPRPL